MSNFQNTDPSKFYKVAEINRMRFYRIPKAFLTNDKYQKLGMAEQYLYGILQDRSELSMKNQWYDENGSIYMVWDRQKLADHLRITRKTVGRYIEKLEKFGLLIDRRKGQGSPNWIYILKPDLEEVDTYKSTTIANTIMGQKVTSRSNLKLQLDESKVYTSDTESNDTDFNDTQSIKKEKPKDDELTEILKKSDVNSLEDKDKNSVLQAIKVLYYSNKPVKSNGVEVSLGEIRKNLKTA